MASPGDRRPAEQGSSVVAFVLALPILLAFLFAVVDVGRAVFLHMALEDAAHAACRAAADRPAEATTAGLHEAALTASPALSGDGLRLVVSARFDEARTTTYVHRLPTGKPGEFEEREAHVRFRPIEVEAVLEGRYLTPLGSALALASGSGDSSFRFVSSSKGVSDETVEGGAW